MTTLEMQYEFETLLSTISEAFAEEERLMTTEVLEYLNWAQKRFIQARYLSGQTTIENLAMLDARQEEIAQLITTYTFSDLVEYTDRPNVYYMNNNVNYTSQHPLHYIESYTLLTRTHNPVISTAAPIKNVLVNYMDLDNFYTTAFNKPIIHFPLVVSGYKAELNPGFASNNSTLNLIVDSYTTPTSLTIKFIREPKKLVLTVTEGEYETTLCELHIGLHQQIVEMAVSMFMDDYKTKLMPKAKQ